MRYIPYLAGYIFSGTAKTQKTLNPHSRWNNRQKHTKHLGTTWLKRQFQKPPLSTGITTSSHTKQIILHQQKYTQNKKDETFS